MMGVNFEPLYYVDISKFFKNKIKSIMKHKSQNPKQLVELIKLMNLYRSAQCNSSNEVYVEAYSFEKSFPFADIRNLIPPSPKINLYNYKNKSSFLN